MLNCLTTIFGFVLGAIAMYFAALTKGRLTPPPNIDPQNAGIIKAWSENTSGSPLQRLRQTLGLDPHPGEIIWQWPNLEAINRAVKALEANPDDPQAQAAYDQLQDDLDQAQDDLDQAQDALDLWSSGIGSRTTPEARAEDCQKLAEIEARIRATGCKWPEIQEQFGSHYTRGWRRQVEKIRQKGGC